MFRPTTDADVRNNNALSSGSVVVERAFGLLRVD